MRTAAKIFSYVFHPLFVPVYLMALTLYLPVYAFSRYNEEIKLYLLGYIFILDVVLPLMSLLILKRYRVISSLQLHQASERSIPYVMMFFTYTFTAWSLGNMAGMHPVISLAFIICALMVLIAAFVNHFFKISAHSASVAAAATWFYLLYKAFGINTSAMMILAVVIAGAVMSSRLVLKAHTPLQIYTGALLGIAVTLFISFLIIP